MLRFEETDVFSEWLTTLQDVRAKTQIMRRLVRARTGNFGDVAPVGEGISEMRVDEGAGYRVYFGRREKVVYILLCGGDKKSQRRDIAAAKQLWAAIKKGTSND